MAATFPYDEFLDYAYESAFNYLRQALRTFESNHVVKLI